jgi:hypothetical protein
MDSNLYTQSQNPQSSGMDFKLILIGVLVVIILGILYLRNKDNKNCTDNIALSASKITELSNQLNDSMSKFEGLKDIKTNQIKKLETYINNITSKLDSLTSQENISATDLESINSLNRSLITLVMTSKSIFPDEFSSIGEPEDKTNLRAFITQFSIDKDRYNKIKNVMKTKVEPLIERSTTIVVNTDKAPEIKLLFTIIGNSLSKNILPELCKHISNKRECTDVYKPNNVNMTVCKEVPYSVDDFKNDLNNELKERPPTKDDIKNSINIAIENIRPVIRLNKSLISATDAELTQIFNYFIGKVFPGSSIDRGITVPDNPTLNVDYIVSIYSQIRGFICNNNDASVYSGLLEQVYDRTGIKL